MKDTHSLNTILVIPSWYSLSNPIEGIFFHEYCNAISSQARVVLLNFNYHSFSARFKKKKTTTTITKYDLLTVDYYNAFPGKWLGLSLLLQKKHIKKKVIKQVKKYNQTVSKISIIHIQSVCNFITPLLASSLANYFCIPYVITEHYTNFKEAGERIFQPFTSSIEIKKIVQNASLRMGVSKYACNIFEQYFECNFEVVPNLIPNDFIDNPMNPYVGIPVGFNFLCIGNFQQRKGQLKLIEAFSKIINECGNSRLIFVGNGPDKGLMAELALSFGIEEKVLIFEQLSKSAVLQMIDSCQVLVSASEIETFGLTIVEALFRGKPVISTMSGGPQELINNNNGLLVETNNIEALAKSMVFIYANYQNYIPNDIKKDAINKFSEDTIVPLMINKYKSVLKTNY